MQRFSRWIPLVVGTLAALLVSLGSYSLANYSWNQVVDYRGPYLSAQLQRPEPGIPVASRVVFVIIDGLRDDTSRRMPALGRLREKGSDWVVEAPQPSLSHPTWTNLMSGAPQRFSGVTTNWYDERVRVETLIDTALDTSRVVVVSAPTDFETLFAVKRARHVYLRDWEEDEYMTGDIVDKAIELTEENDPDLVIVHFPDVDEAGHSFGADSKQYLDTARKVDTDLARLVTSMQSTTTAFVIAADHGHVDAGGHGGWEPEVTRVPAVFAGAGVVVGEGEATQDRVAPTVALLAGLPSPRNGIGEPLPVLGIVSGETGRFDFVRRGALNAYASIAASEPRPAGQSGDAAAVGLARVDAERLARERGGRVWVSLLLALAALAAIAVVFWLSWRAGVAAAAGTAAYYLVYHGAYFWMHGYDWSLSALNTEDMVKAFMNGRMVEAGIAGLIGAAVAADVYLVTRREPKRPEGSYLAGWLSLGTATVLFVQATIGLQVAWYLWRWGASVAWLIPDLNGGFKYDMDLLQLTALAVVALLAPGITYLVGRFHPLKTPAQPAGEAEAEEVPAS